MDITPDDLTAMINRLPQWRREAALRYKFESGRRECAMSYHLLCDLLREYYGITDQPSFAIQEHGKPVLEVRGESLEVRGEGLEVRGESLEVRGEAKREVRANLSHCKRAIACALSDDGEVGIDVECLGRYTERLAEYCMSDAELREISLAEDPDLAFTLLWTKKEALLKYTGEGITDDTKTCLSSSRMDGITIESGYNKAKGYAWSVAYVAR